jgi:hypothetical protein
MERVLILGYYNRNNFWDDLFEYVFRNVIFKEDSYELTFANIDDLQDIVKHNTFSRVVFGGGDIINSYYFSEKNIKDIRSNLKGVHISFYGVGMSYPQLLPILDIGDLFLMRNKVDYEMVKYRYGSFVTSYTPDLGYFLLNADDIVNTNHLKTSIKRIGVCLPYPFFKDHQNENILIAIVNVIKNLSETCEVFIIPFDTSDNKDNSDYLLYNRLRPLLANHEFNKEGKQTIFYISKKMDVGVMLTFFKTLDFIIAGRFHSVVLSLLTETPFVALVVSKKIENMYNEIDADIKQLFWNPSDFTKFNLDDLNEDIARYRVAVKAYKRRMQTAINEAHAFFLDNFRNAKLRSSPPQYISDSEKEWLIEKTVKSITNHVCKKPSSKEQKRIRNGEPLNKIVLKRKKHDHHLQTTVTEEILWQLTGDPYGVYYYGLYENAHCKQLVPQLEWIIDDYYTKYKFRDDKSDNVVIVNKNFQELHRSGWQYIVNNMVIDLNQTNIIKSPLIIDTYVDKTFHWNCSFYKRKNIIPYKVDWIGFIHHTFSSYNNSYNCAVLFKNPLFLESLNKCRCLIVMSHYLKNQIEEVIGEDRVRIEVVYHPTEETGTMFTWERFMSNRDREVVQIGNWLRNVFAIYSLQLPTTSIIKSKSVLKNRNTENYFLPENGFDELISNISGLKNSNEDGTFDMCKITFENMHIKGLLEHIKNLEDSVSTLDYLDNSAYDTLLSQNIVFINLIDASAVNTIIECIMRNTPILVNPIDAALEFLGPNYPLFYSSMYEASKLLDSTEKIHQGYLYLVNMDKSAFKIDTFISQMQRVLGSI